MLQCDKNVSMTNDLNWNMFGNVITLKSVFLYKKLVKILISTLKKSKLAFKAESDLFLKNIKFCYNIM